MGKPRIGAKDRATAIRDRNGMHGELSIMIFQCRRDEVLHIVFLVGGWYRSSYLVHFHFHFQKIIYAEDDWLTRFRKLREMIVVSVRNESRACMSTLRRNWRTSMVCIRSASRPSNHGDKTLSRCCIELICWLDALQQN